jgi:acyl carrier protein
MTKVHDVKDVIIEALNLEKPELEEHEDIRRLSGWDSVNQLRILMAVEARTGLKVPLKEFIACTTVHDIASLLERSS